MVIRKYIYALLALLLTFVGCSKESFEGIGAIDDDALVRIGVEISDRYSSEEIETRAETVEASEREKESY